MTEQKLIKIALEARRFSYSPYSGFQVGAALLSCSGKVYTGCNIENAAFSPSNCAERTAFFKAVSEGVTEFSAIAIGGGKAGETADNFCAPCGVCRQVMAEFCAPETFRILLGKENLEYKEYTLGEILPQGFGKGDIS